VEAIDSKDYPGGPGLNPEASSGSNEQNGGQGRGGFFILDCFGEF